MINDNRAWSLLGSRNKYMNIEDNIKKYLSIEDYEWALAFCNKIISHPEHKEIKKTLRNLKLEMLKKYHNIIENKLNSAEEFDLFISSLNLMFQQQMAITSSLSTVNCVMIESKDDIEEYQKAYDNVWFLLSLDDSPLLIEAERRYDNMAHKIIEENNGDKDLIFIYESERKNLKKFMYDYFKRSYSKFFRQKHSYLDSTEHSYNRDLGLRIHKCQRIGTFGRDKRSFY